MSDPTAQSANEHESEGLDSKFGQPVRDIYLTMLAEITGSEDTDASVPVTLTVAGATISGEMIPDKRWRHLWLEEMSSGDKGQGRQLAKGIREGMESWDAEEESKPREDRPLPLFIHLRDAHLLSPDGVLRIASGLWRGRVSSIDGWALGALSRRLDDQ